MIRPKITEADGDFEVRLQADIFLKLETLACSWGISIHEAIRQLIDAGTRHLEQQDAQLQTLSPKQTEVLKCLKAGLSVKEIASQLSVKEETVRTHIHRVRGILDCSDLLSLRFSGVNGDTPAQRNHRAPKFPPS
jgi:DNA-binding NarL/FixJ family response regulator